MEFFFKVSVEVLNALKMFRLDCSNEPRSREGGAMFGPSESIVGPVSECTKRLTSRKNNACLRPVAVSTEAEISAPLRRICCPLCRN